MKRDSDRIDDREVEEHDAEPKVRVSPAESDFDSVTVRIVECVAEAIGCRAIDLPPLYDVIDPDALEALIPPNGAGKCAVSFRFEGTLVEVHGDGDVAAVRLPADD